MGKTDYVIVVRTSEGLVKLRVSTILLLADPFRVRTIDGREFSVYADDWGRVESEFYSFFNGGLPPDEGFIH